VVQRKVCTVACSPQRLVFGVFHSSAHSVTVETGSCGPLGGILDDNEAYEVKNLQTGHVFAVESHLSMQDLWKK